MRFQIVPHTLKCLVRNFGKWWQSNIAILFRMENIFLSKIPKTSCWWQKIDVGNTKLLVTLFENWWPNIFNISNLHHQHTSSETSFVFNISHQHRLRIPPLYVFWRNYDQPWSFGHSNIDGTTFDHFRSLWRHLKKIQKNINFAVFGFWVSFPG